MSIKRPQGRDAIWCCYFRRRKLCSLKRKSRGKFEILLKFCISFGVTLYLVKFRCDKFLCAFVLLHISRFCASLARILFRKYASWFAPLYLFYYALWYYFAKFSKRYKIFCSVFHLHGSSCLTFMISIADLSSARSHEPRFMLHNSISCRNIGND